MSHSAPQRRKRTVNRETGELEQFLQGSNPAADGRPAYPGDRGICRPDRVSVQIHILDIELVDNSIVKDVPTLAIFAPNAPVLNIVVQRQGQVDT
jgi:hypothetical protein